MVVECTVAELHHQGDGNVAGHIEWLQREHVTHFVEDGGELVSLHGSYAGDEVDLWPSGLLLSDEDFVQWYVDAVGIPVLSHTTGKLYTPTKGIPLG
jgi:hypothetical protein|tara:strand:- start:157 stop:447 length:291 start_codon:yes stop_codon:yes gene_type:complete